MKRKDFIIVIAILIIGIIIGSIFDLNISKSLVTTSGNPFCIAVSAFGEYPVYGGLAFFAGVIYKCNKRFVNKYAVNVLIILACFGVIAFAAYEQGDCFVNYDSFASIIDGIDKIYIYPFLGLLFVLPMAFLGYGLACRVDTKQKFYSLVTIVGAIVVGLGITFFTKRIIARPRFMQLCVNDSPVAEYYRNWFNPLSKAEREYLLSNGASKDGLRSFPSGHATCSAFLMLLIPSLSIFEIKIEKYKTMWFYIGFTVSLFVSFYRIRSGAHFLSDVCFGMLITTIVSFVANEIMTKYFQKKEETKCELE